MDKTTNLNEFYKSQNQSLPSISDRAVSATNAGIQNYQGTVQQNSQLLDYLKKNSTSSLSNVPATNITMKPSDFTSVPVVNIPVNTPRQAPTTPVQSVLSQRDRKSVV